MPLPKSHTVWSKENLTDKKVQIRKSGTFQTEKSQNENVCFSQKIYLAVYGAMNFGLYPVRIDKQGFKVWGWSFEILF